MSTGREITKKRKLSLRYNERINKIDERPVTYDLHLLGKWG